MQNLSIKWVDRLSSTVKHGDLRAVFLRRFLFNLVQLGYRAQNLVGDAAYQIVRLHTLLNEIRCVVDLAENLFQCFVVKVSGLCKGFSCLVTLWRLLQLDEGMLEMRGHAAEDPLDDSLSYHKLKTKPCD
jgi:hypothetical protein